MIAATTEELGILVDALYRNLDTPTPVYGAQDWYDLATEELARRSVPAAPDARGVA